MREWCVVLTSSYDDMVRHWRVRLVEWERLGVLVSGAAVAKQVLDDLQTLATSSGNELLNLREAAHLSGYSADHLGREVRAGRIPNHGRSGAPRIRRGDLPRKAGHRPPESPLLSAANDATIQDARRRIAVSIARS